MGAGPPGPAAGPVGVDELPPARRAARQGHRVRPRRRRRADPPGRGGPGRGHGPDAGPVPGRAAGPPRRHPATGHRPVPAGPGRPLRARRPPSRTRSGCSPAATCSPSRPRTATRDGVDFDHVKAYDRDGPPGQTGTHNSGPLRRRHHRWKTHGGYRCRQAGPGRHLWQTPHGLCFLVDHTGTHRLDPEAAEIILTAPPGIDVYVPDVRLQLDCASVGRGALVCGSVRDRHDVLQELAGARGSR